MNILLKTGKELKEEAEDIAFRGIKKELREEFKTNLIRTIRDARILGFDIKEIKVINYYREILTPLSKSTILGVKIID